jgi:hypothetical protein
MLRWTGDEWCSESGFRFEHDQFALISGLRSSLVSSQRRIFLSACFLPIAHGQRFLTSIKLTYSYRRKYIIITDFNFFEHIPLQRAASNKWKAYKAKPLGLNEYRYLIVWWEIPGVNRSLSFSSLPTSQQEHSLFITYKHLIRKIQPILTSTTPSQTSDSFRILIIIQIWENYYREAYAFTRFFYGVLD